MRQSSEAAQSDSEIKCENESADYCTSARTLGPHPVNEIGHHSRGHRQTLNPFPTRERICTLK
jgi:hypothetical protein